ncbi:MAG TPA: hypothetical protein P5044_03435 [bacterium]|nr:hypothetical protein [bacterium]
MNTFRLLFVFLSAFIFVSCTVDDENILIDNESVKDADTAETVDEAVDENIVTDNETVNDDDNMIPDEDQADESVAEPDDLEEIPDEELPAGECGNGKLEKDELCETGDSIDCTELGNFTSGTATCTVSCTFETTQCITAVATIGKVSANVAANFLINEDRFMSGDTQYVISSISKFLTDGFNGTLNNGDTIPHKDITHRNAMPFRSKTTVFIHQQSKKKEGDNDYFLNPHVQFFMPSADVKLGIYSVDMLKNSATMYIYKFLDPNDPNNNSVCVWGVAIGGSINVTLAQNTAAPDGGQIHFTGTDIPLYYVKETPYGDLSANVGTDICDN